MSKRLKDCLNGAQGNYILPFFWQHGESEAVLREYMQAIRHADIREVCLEARPHPDYAGETWFRDVDIILDEAKKLGMKIWILDDAHFPSGQAAGKMREQPDELCKQYLNYHLADVTGPTPQVTLDVAVMARQYLNPFAPRPPFVEPETREFHDDALFAVIASRLDGKENDMYHLDDTLLDLTDEVKDGILTWDVPAGSWRVLVIHTTRINGGRGGYVNFLSKASCRVQIDACYEPHWARYKDEFGKTILGFFSDEPEIGNVMGYSGADAAIGNPAMPLPWSEEMPAEMTARFGKDYRRLIPALWMPVGDPDLTADVRVGFMDIVSRLCRQNFAGQIGEWCREHGVKYIGHIVEDNDNSVKLGSSQGHFFRALWGQDWAGIDNIGGQVTEGGENISHNFFTGTGNNGEFYHHVLGKLGTSLADIDPKKQGNAMCEIFGAYGWQEGTRLMKYEADHFLVRGINHYVPHAFSPNEFPDHDCPPHFYAHGKNPLYPPFGTLMTYMNRVSHLISGGRHITAAGILYHAEAEWSGKRYMDMVKPARALDDAQIDYDFLPADIFYDPDCYTTELKDGVLYVNGQPFYALVIPGAEYLPESVIAFAKKAKKDGFPVLFVDWLPAELAADYTPTGLHDLAGALALVSFPTARTLTPFSSLEIYNYAQEEETYYLVSNECMDKVYDGTVRLPVTGPVYRYDAFRNVLLKANTAADAPAGFTDVALKLAPYEMAILIVSDDQAYAEAVTTDPGCTDPLIIPGPWQVSFSEQETYPDFRDAVTLQKLENILKVKPDFSGVIRYETAVTPNSGDYHWLVLENAYESAEVWVNDQPAGVRICPPYKFEISGLLQEGENRIRIEVRTTLERKVHQITGGMDIFGPEMLFVAPEGIIGEVCLK